MNLITQWYGVAIAGTAACLLVYRIGSVTSKFLVSRFKSLALRLIAYPLILRRYWTGVTRLQGAMIGSYFIINGFCMGLGIKNNADLMARSGMMAAINLVPLFLGGRTSMLANFLGISLHTYYLAHHWIGRVVIVQGILHAVLALTAGKPWTFNSSQISAISATSALALIGLLSLFFIRKLMYEVFLKTHLFLSFVAVIGLLLHVAPAGSAKSIFSIVSLSLWGLNNALRLSRVVYYNLGRRRQGRKSQATIKHFSGGSTDDEVSAVRLTVQLPKERKVRPGEYYYLFLSEMGTGRRFQSHPYVVAWWDYPMAAKTLSFLIKPQDGVSADLAGRKSIRRVILDGPYGKDLHLDNCENIILIARGIGIAGILPYARHMAERRLLPDNQYWAYQYRRGLITRKIDVYWVLEDNSQQEWVADWIRELRDIDEKNLFLTFACFYPNKQVHPPPIPEAVPEGTPEGAPKERHWRFFYEEKTLQMIEGFIVKRAQRSPGKTKIAVCGSSGFTDEVRDIVLKTMKEYKEVEFVETEFRPQGKDDINNTGVQSGAAGFSSKVKTINEARDELNDLEKGLSDSRGRKAPTSEII